MAPYPHGSDYGWLACDRDDRFAIFITAGVGPIPCAILADRENADRAEDLVWELPDMGGAHLHVHLPRPDDFIGFARRGLFAYDWSDVHRTTNKLQCYERCSSPTRPIRLHELPPELASLAKRVCFPALLFVDRPTLCFSESVSNSDKPA